MKESSTTNLSKDYTKHKKILSLVSIVILILGLVFIPLTQVIYTNANDYGWDWISYCYLFGSFHWLQFFFFVNIPFTIHHITGEKAWLKN